MWKLVWKIMKTGRLTEPLPAGTITVTEPPEYSKSLAIRHVDAGSCNGCELELQALGNPYYSIESRGMKFVASPRHADLLLVTGPVTCAMKEALSATHSAVPSPKRVVAVGDCARNGGVFQGSYAILGGVDKVVPVDVYVPGCPPDPPAVIEGLRRAFAQGPIEPEKMRP
jgi:Ni,Fe-hydrogenase III small subunit